jgi:hypothetical protein
MPYVVDVARDTVDQWTDAISNGCIGYAEGRVKSSDRRHRLVSICTDAATDKVTAP